MVVLPRGHAAVWLRRMHPERGELLARRLGVLDLLGDSIGMLSAETATPVVAIALAAVAGFSQLFSP